MGGLPQGGSVSSGVASRERDLHPGRGLHLRGICTQGAHLINLSVQISTR